MLQCIDIYNNNDNEFYLYVILSGQAPPNLSFGVGMEKPHVFFLYALMDIQVARNKEFNLCVNLGWLQNAVVHVDRGQAPPNFHGSSRTGMQINELNRLFLDCPSLRYLLGHVFFITVLKWTTWLLYIKYKNLLFSNEFLVYLLLLHLNFECNILILNNCSVRKGSKSAKKLTWGLHLILLWTKGKIYIKINIFGELSL